MRTIKLHFTDQRFLEGLNEDAEFMNVIGYMTPVQLDTLNIVLTDSITQHSRLDTEVVILSIFAVAIKRIFYASSDQPIEFLNPFVDRQKGGIRHDGELIIDSTDLELFSFTTTHS